MTKLGVVSNLCLFLLPLPRAFFFTEFFHTQTHTLSLFLLFCYLPAERKSEVGLSVTATPISARAVAEKLSRSKDLSPAPSSRFSFSLLLPFLSLPYSHFCTSCSSEVHPHEQASGGIPTRRKIADDEYTAGRSERRSRISFLRDSGGRDVKFYR